MKSTLYHLMNDEKKSFGFKISYLHTPTKDNLIQSRIKIIAALTKSNFWCYYYNRSRKGTRIYWSLRHNNIIEKHSITCTFSIALKTMSMDTINIRLLYYYFLSLKLHSFLVTSFSFNNVYKVSIHRN